MRAGFINVVWCGIFLVRDRLYFVLKVAVNVYLFYFVGASTE